ncbi:MAG: helix-turn-helix domain-containing protein [Pseudomonadota bacterium]
MQAVKEGLLPAINALYETVGESGFRDCVLDVLQQVSGASSTAYRVASASGELLHDSHLTDADIARYRYARENENPVMPLAVPQLLARGMVRISDVLPLSQYRRTDFFSEWCEPYNRAEECGITLDASDDSLIMLVTSLALDDGDLIGERYQRVQQLVPTIRRAHALHRSVIEGHPSANLPENRILLDLKGKVLGKHGDLTEYLFSNHSLSYDSEGCLVGPKSRNGASFFEQLIFLDLGFTLGTHYLAMNTPAAFIKVNCQRLDRSVLRERVSAHAAYLVWFEFADVTKAATQLYLNTRFKLTDKEVAVLSLLCDGLSASEIATLQSNSVNTIRTHIKNVLAKTDQPSQLKLVQMMLPLFGRK